MDRDKLIAQTRLIVEVSGLSWRYVRNLPQDERDALEHTYRQRRRQ